jgi:hypothetical protein
MSWVDHPKCEKCGHDVGPSVAQCDECGATHTTAGDYPGFRVTVTEPYEHNDFMSYHACSMACLRKVLKEHGGECTRVEAGDRGIDSDTLLRLLFEDGPCPHGT